MPLCASSAARRNPHSQHDNWRLPRSLLRTHPCDEEARLSRSPYAATRNRRSDDAKVRCPPICSDDEILSQVLDLIFEIRLAWPHRLESQVRVAGVGIAPFGLLSAP